MQLVFFWKVTVDKNNTAKDLFVYCNSTCCQLTAVISTNIIFRDLGDKSKMFRRPRDAFFNVLCLLGHCDVAAHDSCPVTKTNDCLCCWNIKMHHLLHTWGFPRPNIRRSKNFLLLAHAKLQQAQHKTFKPNATLWSKPGHKSEKKPSSFLNWHSGSTLTLLSSPGRSSPLSPPYNNSNTWTLHEELPLFTAKNAHLTYPLLFSLSLPSTSRFWNVSLIVRSDCSPNVHQ